MNKQKLQKTFESVKIAHTCDTCPSYNNTNEANRHFMCMATKLVSCDESDITKCESFLDAHNECIEENMPYNCPEQSGC